MASRHIFTLTERDQLKDGVCKLIEELRLERHRSFGMLPTTETKERNASLQKSIDQLISKMNLLVIAMEYGGASLTQTDMHAASISYQETILELSHISKEKMDHTELDRIKLFPDSFPTVCPRYGQTDHQFAYEHGLLDSDLNYSLSCLDTDLEFDDE
jgi:hypothetical protein